MAAMPAQVEELAPDRVRLTVEVARDDVKHAIEHAAADLAEGLRIPGFRKGKVPMPVLLARVGRERLHREAVESHIGGWFWRAAEEASVQPVERPEYEYELPDSGEEPFRFAATVAVQAPPEPADWTTLEVPAPEAEVPDELVDRELDALRSSVAPLGSAGDRPAREGDVLVVDLVSETGEAQRDYIVEVGAGRLLEEIETGLVGMAEGDEKTIEVHAPNGQTSSVHATLKELKEKVLPPLDDDFARAASEFGSLGELRGDIASDLREQLEEELEAQFRAAAADRLVEASNVQVAETLVEARASELANALGRSLERRGLSADMYFRLSGRNADDLRSALRDEARQAIARELILESVARKLAVEVSDEELRAVVREQAEELGEDPEAAITQVWEAGGHERLRADLRLRKALDRVAEEVQRIPVDLARAREKLWTPGQEKPETSTKLWTPSSKEPA